MKLGILLILILLSFLLILSVQATTITVQPTYGTIYFARGDSTSITGLVTNQSLKTELTFWLIGENYLRSWSLNSSGAPYWVFNLSEEETAALKLGDYTGIAELTGPNGVIEVLYDLNSSELTSPFRGYQNTPVSVADTKLELYNKLMYRLKNSDDQVNVYSIIVEEPWISVLTQEVTKGVPGEEEITLTGETNLGTNNQLIALIDPTRQTDQEKIKKATTVLSIQNYTDFYHMRNTWIITFNMTGLYPGDHTMKVSSPSHHAEVDVPFFMREVVTATATTVVPTYNYVFPDNTEAPTVVPTTPEPTQTQIIIIQTPEPVVITQVPVTTLLTPAPNITANRSPRGNAKKLPLAPIVPIFGLVLALVILKR